MSKYTSSKGNIYSLQEGYTSGDMVVLSDNGDAWRINAAVLVNASPVFRDMFAMSPSSAREFALPDTNADRYDTSLFLDTISHRLTQRLHTPSFTNAMTAIGLCRKYDCVEAAKQLLYHSVGDLEPGELFEAFVLASQVNDPVTGCRILAQGYRWYKEEEKPSEPSLAPESSQRPWKAGDADRIRSSWLWALTLASTICTARPDEKGDKSAQRFRTKMYWAGLTGLFMPDSKAPQTSTPPITPRTSWTLLSAILIPATYVRRTLQPERLEADEAI